VQECRLPINVTALLVDDREALETETELKVLANCYIDSIRAASQEVLKYLDSLMSKVSDLETFEGQGISTSPARPRSVRRKLGTYHLKGRD